MTDTAVHTPGGFDPDGFSDSGGFFDDKDVVVLDAKVVTFDYQGKSPAVCALMVRLKDEKAEEEANSERTEYYKIGELSKFTPSADGEQYIPVGTTPSMNKNCKAAYFFRALKEKGFEFSRIAKGVSGLKGLRGHVNDVPLPEIAGSAKKDNKALIFTKLYDGAPAANGSGAKAKASKAEAPAAAGNDEAEAKVTEIVLGLLSDNNGTINKAKIPQALFQKVTDPKLRNACIALAKDAWLSSGDRPWAFNGGELSLG